MPPPERFKSFKSSFKSRNSVVLVLQMVLNTSADAGDLREVMNFVYDEIYVEYIVKNPLHTPGQAFQ